MKNIFKKLLVLMLSLTVAFAAVGTGCKNDEEEGGSVTPDIFIPEPPAPTLVLNRTSLNLTIGDYFTMTATAANTTNPVVWSTDNANVASVSATGVIEALNEGVVNITATCGSLAKTCEVIVSFGGQTPEIDILGGFKDDIILSTNSEFQLDPVVRFNNRTDYTDATFSYVSSDPNVLSVSQNGLITTQGSGNVDVTISANWRGKKPSNTFLLSKTINVTVQDNLIFYLNGDMVNDINLYTRDEFEGSNYVNSVACVPTVSINGATQVPATSIVVDKPEIATFDGSNLVAKNFGDTLVTINYELNGKNFIKNFNVRVDRPIAQKVGKVEYFSAYQGLYKDENDLETNLTLDNFIWGTETTIVDAYHGENKLRVENNAILDLVVNADDFTDVVISVGSSTEIYEVSLRAAGQFVKTVQDLKDAVELRVGPAMAAKRAAAEANGINPASTIDYNDIVRKTGYVYLLGDVDASTLEVHHTASASIWHHADEMSFAATFEGNGHVISNVNLQKLRVSYQNNNAGLFAHLGKGAKIQNVAFTNVSCVNGQLFAFISYGHISNVYVQYNPDSVKPQGITYYTYAESRANNLVVEYNPSTPYDASNLDYTSGVGVLYASPSPTLNPKTEVQEALFKDVYVLSEFALANYRDVRAITKPGYDATINKFWYMTYASNATVDHFGKEIVDATYDPASEKSEKNTGIFRYKNVKQYDNAADMAQANNDLSNFDSKYWEISSGVPVWHTFKSEGVTLSVEGVAPKAPVQVVKGESVIVGLAKNGELLPGTTITTSDDSVVSVDGANVSVIKYSAANVTITVKNDVVGVEETFEIKPIIDVNVKLGNTSNITTYAEIFQGETLTFSVDGVTDISIASNDTSIVSVNGASIIGGNIDETAITVTFTAGGVQYVVPLTIYVKGAPSSEDNVVLYDADAGEIIYDDLDGKLILDAQLILDGADPVELTIKDNKIFGLPKMATGKDVAHMVKLVVNTNYNRITFNNVEYWDDIFYSVQEFGETFSLNADNEALIGWYALGSDIDFYLGDVNYKVTDKKHEFVLKFGNDHAWNGAYYLINPYDKAANKNVSITNFDKNSNNGFGGVFDGRGYSMNNFANFTYKFNPNNGKFYIFSGTYGVFAKLYSSETVTPVIKNFAFKNMIASNDSPVIANNVSAVGVQYIENVYVHARGGTYSAYLVDEDTNVMTQNIAISGYSTAGLVYQMGRTYVKNVVMDLSAINAAANFNISNRAIGALGGTFNEIVDGMNIATYDANYLENFVILGHSVVSANLNQNKTIDKIVIAGGTFDPSKYVRNAERYVAYSSNNDTTNKNSIAHVFQGYKDGTTIDLINAEIAKGGAGYLGGNAAYHDMASDVLEGVAVADVNYLAQKGVYKFANSISFENPGKFAEYAGLAELYAKFGSTFWTTTENGIVWLGANN